MDAYRPPSAVLSEPPPLQTAKRFRIVPVIVGGLVIDYLGSTFASIWIGLGIGFWILLSGGSPEEVGPSPASSPLFVGAGFVVGSCLTVLGAYVAARWAGARFVLHGLASGSISLALNLPFLFFGDATVESAWITYAGLGIQLPLAATGGWLAARRAARLLQPLPSPLG